ncbi:hypothetical protein D7231_34285 [Streptomyces klenkii]|uniref:AbiJ-NTD3 domain-containing protein n=1 Tax=Streptomyces klenkii TaxID=1420899 RepID=A0A3B0AFP5_9ACTN|nr:hypothetical protein [Streptomyces klenkii]RKN59435.1 hypothetical protein D7231_34285 [Streptomyces klenkii]
MTDRVTPHMLREAIADTLRDCVKSYHLAAVCESLGLEPEREDEDPHRSKRWYVLGRLQTRQMAELATIAQRVTEEFGGRELIELVGRLGVRGVAGELKNLIFAADGPKPELVLADALNNVICITKNEQYCLVYDQPLADHGLTWRELVSWWTNRNQLPTDAGKERDNALHLYGRLERSMQHNGLEMEFFKTYAALYKQFGFGIPALIPQVYLHYDPYVRRRLTKSPGPLARQRMDFLLLMPARARIVIEIDGLHHYANDDGRADDHRYAEMVAEDRKLRLAGYEVYRFGAAELKRDRKRSVVSDFFRELLESHHSLPAASTAT